MLSAIYMSRQIWLIFGGKTREKSIENHLVDGNLWIKIPIVILAICSTFLIGIVLEIPFPHLNFITIFNLILVYIGIGITYIFRNKLMVFGNYQSKMDLFFQKIIIKPTLILTEKIQIIEHYIFDGVTKLITQFTIYFSEIVGWIDTHLVDGMVSFIYKSIGKIGRIFSGFQAGQVQWYVSAMMLIIIVIFILVGNIS
jgi:NADH-quinone oxidoreductase subunit L